MNPDQNESKDNRLSAAFNGDNGNVDATTFFNKDLEGFGTIPKDSEAFGRIPTASESFGTIPSSSEGLRNGRMSEEAPVARQRVDDDSISAQKMRRSQPYAIRKESHTLTVRQVARMLDAAGVPRTERSIVNWCQINRTGFARLDAYYDGNDHRYYISPMSVEAVMQEELAKAGQVEEAAKQIPEFGSSRTSERGNSSPIEGDEMVQKLEEAEREIFDLKITNRAKDQFIDMLQNDREKLYLEKEGYVRKMLSFSEKIGQLTTRLFTLGDRTSLDASRWEEARGGDEEAGAL